MERMCREGKGKILKMKNNYLHESLLLQPTVILIFFCNLKIFILSGEFTQNSKPYVITEWKYE